MKRPGIKTIAVSVLLVVALVGLVIAGPGRDGRGQRDGRDFGSERCGRSDVGMGRHGGEARHGGMAIMRMLHGLELTDEQKESVKEITEAAKEKNKAAAEAVGEARKALQEAVDKGEEAAIRKAATDLGKALGDEAVLKAQTMTSIKKVLTPEQLKELEELKAKMKERAEGFRGREDGPRSHDRGRGFRGSRRSREHRGEDRGFGPRNREHDIDD